MCSLLAPAACMAVAWAVPEVVSDNLPSAAPYSAVPGAMAVPTAHSTSNVPEADLSLTARRLPGFDGIFRDADKGLAGAGMDDLGGNLGGAGRDFDAPFGFQVRAGDECFDSFVPGHGVFLPLWGAR